MNKKTILAVLVLLFAVAIFLSGCNLFDDKDDKKDETPEDPTWQRIESPTPTDVYKQLLAGVMNVATDFSIRSLESSPVLGADAKLKLTLSDADLWLTFRGNYDHRNKHNAMFCLEITRVEDSYDDVVIAFYLCKEVMYITLGSTKFKFDLPHERWENVFPFELGLDNASTINNVSALLYTILSVKDDKINGKTRLNGLVEEYNYNFSLDLAGTLAKVQNYMTKNKSDVELVDKINNIFANVLGLSVANIVAGNVPESRLDIDFTNANTKLSAFSCNIHIDQSGEYANTLFKGEDIDLDIELVKFSTSKSNITIDFVNSQEKQSQFIDYLQGSYSFKLELDIEKEISKDPLVKKDYTLVLSAKIFQEEAINNFLFLEYYDKNNVLEKAIYAYNNDFYIFDTIDNGLECLAKAELNVSRLADNVYNNTFDGEKGEGSFNLFNTVSHIIGVLKMDDEGFLFKISQKIFEDVWFNYQKMLEFIDGLFVEDIFSEEYKLKEFESFLTDYDSTANFVFEKEFLSMMEDNNELITNALMRMDEAEPLYIFTRVDAADPND